jgi:D-amino-acid dehydrogenase
MVGVATALELQRLGAQVTLIDRCDPGQETSYGNNGVIARSALMSGQPTPIDAHPFRAERFL